MVGVRGSIPLVPTIGTTGFLGFFELSSLLRFSPFVRCVSGASTSSGATAAALLKRLKEQRMEISPKPKICFILGINQRSGTNFIYRLLGEHPSCAASGPIWEDHFLRHSKMLIDYANALFKSWNPIWEVEKKIGGQEMLLRHFGDAIEHFLRLQVIRDSPHQIPPKLLLTKTPNVIGLDNFFDLFPGAYLILLVRDGRAVVEFWGKVIRLELRGRDVEMACGSASNSQLSRKA